MRFQKRDIPYILLLSPATAFLSRMRDNVLYNRTKMEGKTTFSFNSMIFYPEVFWWFHPIMQLLGIPSQNICKSIATFFYNTTIWIWPSQKIQTYPWHCSVPYLVLIVYELCSVQEHKATERGFSIPNLLTFTSQCPEAPSEHSKGLGLLTLKDITDTSTVTPEGYQPSQDME